MSGDAAWARAPPARGAACLANEAVARSMAAGARVPLRRVDGDADRRLWRELVGRYHYLGPAVPFGAHLRWSIDVVDVARFPGAGRRAASGTELGLTQGGGRMNRRKRRQRACPKAVSVYGLVKHARERLRGERRATASAPTGTCAPWVSSPASSAPSSRSTSTPRRSSSRSSTRYESSSNPDVPTRPSRACSARRSSRSRRPRRQARPRRRGRRAGRARLTPSRHQATTTDPVTR